MNDNLSYNPAATDPNYQPGVPPQWNPPTTPPKKKQWFKNPLLLIPVGTLLLGLSIGGAKTETVEVTKEIPGPERTVTKEVKVNVPTTPAACIEALSLYEQVVDYSGEALGYSNDALQAAARLDAAGIEAAGSKMKSLTPKLQAMTPKVNAAKAECRAAQ
jgi:hypothetical protein